MIRDLRPSHSFCTGRSLVKAMARSIEVRGPDQAGEFVATLPNGQTRLVRFWDDLDRLKDEWGVVEATGDIANLKHRSRPD